MMFSEEDISQSEDTNADDDECCGCGCLRLDTKTWTRRVLRPWHIAAAGVQGASLIAQIVLLIVFYDKLLLVSVTSTNSLGKCTELFRYPAAWFVVIFTFLTTISHVIQASLSTKHWTRELLENGTGANWLRWGEYDVTASLMTVVIAQTATVHDILLLVLLVVLNVVMQLLGGLHEERHRGAQWLIHPNGTLEHIPTQRRQWMYHVLGWVLFAGTWLIIFYYFFSATSIATPPWFVYAVVIVLFVQYALFGIAQLVTSLAEAKVMRHDVRVADSEAEKSDDIGVAVPIGSQSASQHQRVHTLATIGLWLFARMVRKNADNGDDVHLVGTGYPPAKTSLFKHLGDRRVVEIVYISLSLFAKLSLEWLVFAGLIDLAVTQGSRMDFLRPCQ